MLSRLRSPLVLLSFCALACSAPFDLGQDVEQAWSAPAFTEPWIYELHVGEVALDVRGDDYRELSEADLIRVETVDEAAGTATVTLTDEGLRQSAGWVKVGAADSQTWHIPVARRLPIEVRGDDPQQIELVWSWIPVDEYWESLAGLEGLLWREFKTEASFAREGSGWVLDTAAWAGQLELARPGARMTSKATLPRLVRCLDEDDVNGRVACTIALGYLGDASVAEPLAGALLRDPDPRVRYKAAGALWRIGSPASVTVPALAQGVEDPDPRVAFNSVLALRKMGPAAKAAVPALLRAMEPGSPVRVVALGVWEDLATIAEPAVPALAAALTDPDPQARREAADSLQALGPTAGSAHAALGAALGDRNKTVRRRVARTLLELGADAAPELPALTRALEDVDGIVRATAAETIGRLGPAAATAVPALLACLQDDWEEVRLAAAAALGRDLGVPAATLRPALEAALSDENADVRFQARRSLDGLP